MLQCMPHLSFLSQYLEKLELMNLTSVANVYPDEKCCAQFILRLINEEVELKVSKPSEAGKA